jgi:hypothetical protein
MNLGREIRTIRIIEEPESVPQPVEEPAWPEPSKEPASK